METVEIYKDLMIDIETLGTTPGSVITQIGGCYFDRATGKLGETFCMNIRIQDSLDKGFIVDGGAIRFWFEQNDEARKSIIIGAEDLLSVLNRFKVFCKDAKAVWSHATFDVPLLGWAFKHVGLGQPFPYRNARDIRTLVDLSKVAYKKYEKTGVSHNALDDCIHQIRYCTVCFKQLP